MVNWQLNLLIALQLLRKPSMFNKINDFETSELLAIVLNSLEHRDDTPLETVFRILSTIPQIEAQNQIFINVVF